MRGFVPWLGCHLEILKLALALTSQKYLSGRHEALNELRWLYFSSCAADNYWSSI